MRQGRESEDLPEQLNKNLRESMDRSRIEQHLKSAVDELTPDIFDKLDLSVPQEPAWGGEQQAELRILKYQRRLRAAGLASVACLCVMMAGGGAFHYHMVNRRVESVIGLDVNPSVELSINKKERVLQAQALNEDGEELLEGMDLEGVELNVAVNAVVGSMVTHGYLDDLDNAILVTVSNDSVRKAKELRASVVRDIENTLSENQVQAVVYDQQVIEDEQMKELAEEYDISYGKAYFLKELIDQNADLTMEDMEKLSAMTMEEIAAEIAGRSYALGELADQATLAAVSETEALVPETESIEETTEATEPETEDTTAAETEPVTTEPAVTETAPETTEEEPEVEEDLVEIDYVDCEGDTVYVCFVTRVKWKNPTVAVRDDEGNSYAALVDETSKDDCVISVSGMEGGRTYTFVLGGLIPVEGDTATTVTGYFEKPEIADGATEAAEEDQTAADTDDDDDFDTADDDNNGSSGNSNKGDSGNSSSSGIGGNNSGNENGSSETSAAKSDEKQDSDQSDGSSGSSSQSGSESSGGRQDEKTDGSDAADKTVGNRDNSEYRGAGRMDDNAPDDSDKAADSGEPAAQSFDDEQL